MAPEVLFRYAGESSAAGHSVSLATTIEEGEPVFFDCFAEHPAPTALALLAVARVARTRFYEPPGMVAARIAAADPVVTAEPERLRFESFSACCGVHARLDLLPDGLDVGSCAAGTTNVDFNPPMREALARIGGRDPLQIRVGHDAVQVRTLDAAVTERRVTLPERWVNGFGEVQVALVGARPRLQMDAIEARRFVADLPRGRAGELTLWAARAGGGVRLTPTRRDAAVPVAGAARLRPLEPLTRFATSLSAYGEVTGMDGAPAAWVIELPGARMTLTLSPDRARGFSGEGGLLMHLARPEAREDADAVELAILGIERFTEADASARSGLEATRTRTALAWLGSHGHLGYDAATAEYFRRRLPYPADLLASDPPRLRDARGLVAAGAVAVASDRSCTVRSDKREYVVRLDSGGYACTCPWIARHGTSRGPCKHVLAAAIVT